MARAPYRVTPARIGNSSGLRWPAAFYRDHPQFAGAAGQVEVLSDNTLLLRLESPEPQNSDSEEDSLMLELLKELGSLVQLAALAGEGNRLFGGDV